MSTDKLNGTFSPKLNTGFYNHCLTVEETAKKKAASLLNETLLPPKLIPSLVDETAALNPDKPFAEVPISPTGYGTIEQARLMKETQCNHLLISSAIATAPATAIADEHGNLHLWTLPDLADQYDTERKFAYTKTYEEAKNEPLVVIHSSETSDFPKPIL